MLLCALASLLFLASPAQAQTTPTYQISGAFYGSAPIQAPVGAATQIPAGIAGGIFQLFGTLPTAAQQAQTALLGCFYTGYGSTTGFPLSAPSSTGIEPLTVPASTIQSIPQTAFVATNSFALTGYLYFIRSGSPCDGTFDATLTNRYPVTIVAPAITSYTGPTRIPKTNTATSVASPPTFLTLPATGVLANGQYGASSATTVTFGTFGAASTDLASGVLHIAVPPSFSSSPVGTTTSLTICNTFSTTSVCTTPSPAITLTVTALATSSGILTATPNPVTTAGQTTLTAQFFKTGTAASPGAPSGPVTFTAGTATVPAANLVLDKTAFFTTQSTSLTVPTAATPVITPAAGSFLNSTTVTITDATTGAAIYYTQDGSTPTASSTPYSAPFQITASQTIKAIAVAAGSLPSAVASTTYTITVSPPAKLAFTVQPVNTAISTAITPAVQVTIQDANGVTVNNSTLPVTLALANNSSSATLGGTLTVNAVNGVATFSNLTVDTIANGYALAATSSSLTRATSSTFNITPYPITMAVQSALIGINSTLNGTITLGRAAPTGGLAVTLASDTPANVTIAPATLNIAAGQTTGSFTYTGVASGNATLSASATNYQTGTAAVTGTAAQVSLGTIPSVAPGQSVSLALSLPSAAPPGGTTVTFTSSNTSVATVTSTITVPAGQRTATTNPQITGVTIGTTNIVASAPGFAPDTRPASVTVVASFSPSSTSINLATSTNTLLSISAPAPVGGVAFTLTSDAPATATVGANVTIPAGSTSAPITLTGVANGSTTIRANSPGVTEATTSVTVNSTISFSNSNVITGANMETQVSPYLPTSSPTPITVTVTVTNPAIASISKTATDVGGTTLTFTNITSGGYTPAVYIQGQTVGTTTLTVSAPGYTTGTTTLTVYPSGFGFIYSGNFSTTTFSAPTTLSVTPVVLNPTSLTLYTYGLQLNPGISPVSVPVTSGTTSVGTIVTSPVVFNPGDNGKNTTFQPSTAGTSTITLGTPAGYSTPASSQPQFSQITATVTAPALTFNTNPTTGVNQETNASAYLPVAPPSPVTATVTVGNPAIATISTSATVVGGAVVTFPNTNSAGYLPTIYVQGQTVGTTTLTVSVPGYSDGTATVTVDPSGFAFIYSGSFSTTTFSDPTSITVTPVVLNPGSLTLVTYGLQLNPGVTPVSVPVNSGTTSVGTITTSPLVFGPGDTGKTTTFKPVAAGASTLTLGTPTGYSTPASSQPQFSQLTATVTAPQLSWNTNPLTGVNLQATIGAYLPVAPPNPVAVTVTINGPTTAKISKTSTDVGQTTLTFPNISTAGYIPTIYVQGQAVGTTTITVSAPGYTSATANVTVDPTGFAFIYSGSFSTTTFSTPTSLAVTPVVLNPGTLTLATYGLPISPGVAAISVPVVSGTTSVGTISASPLVFNPGDTGMSTNFQPVAAGTSTITLGTPTGYSTPASSQPQYSQLTATVTAPALTFNTNVTTGVNQEGTIAAYIPVAPPNPITVTVTSNGPAIATISKSGTVVGGTTLTFTNVTTAGYLPTIYVQGQSVGSTTLTVSAPGYTNGNATITVDPSGFGFIYVSNFSTTTFSTASTLTVTPVVLNPGTLTLNTYGLQVNPGLGSISVPVTSGTPSVGTITTSPVIFNAGDSGQSTSFQPSTAGTTVLSVVAPAGYSTPSQAQYNQATATVTAPALYINPNTTGVKLETGISASLQTPPPNPVTVTVTSSDPTIATLSTSSTVAGTASITFTNVTSSIPVIYVQGQAVGTATLTVSAPGYTSGTSTETVNPSGFAFAYNSSISTSATSSPTSLTVYPFILNPGNLTVAGNATLNPGVGTISVPVTSSNPATGVITTSPLVFSSGDTQKSTTFQPLATGTSTLTVQPPTGFSTPSQYQQITATVQ